MTAYPKPASQWFARQLAALKLAAAANTAGGTEYTIEYPQRATGDERPEHDRGVSVAITGNLSHDHQGNATGLSGFGQAVYNTTSKTWEKVQE